jgi:flagellar protein FliS
MQATVGAYQAAQTLTADPPRLMLLLFDGATRFLRRALKALGRGEHAQFVQSLSRAHAIIEELADSLNHEAGGEIARNLTRLYAFMLLHLTQGLIDKSPAHLERVLALLATLREGFEHAVASVSGGPAA